MSTSPVTALRAAIRTALLADTTLTAMLGGPNVFDEAPRSVNPPYVTFGDALWRDLSTRSDTGAEQFVILNAWSLERGRHEALDIATRVLGLIQDQPLVMTGFNLVNLRLVSLETRREHNGRFARASLKLRAYTEAL